MRSSACPAVLGPLVLALAWLPAAARADSFCGAAETPVLEVVSSNVATSARPAPGFAQEQDVAAFLFQDRRAVISNRAWEVDFQDSLRKHDTAQIARGTGPAELWNGLNALLQTMRVGVQASCFLNAPGIGMMLDVTWHGRAGRSNRFVITSADNTLPACPDAVETFVTAIGGYVGAVLAAPATERLSVPPL